MQQQNTTSNIQKNAPISVGRGAGGEAQYIDLFRQCRTMICDNSAEAMNAVREAAFEDFQRLGLPTKKVERYRYTDIPKIFAPDYGLNLKRLRIPVNPYDAFRCDVPNLSTNLYFVVNDMFYDEEKPKSHLPEGVVVDSLRKFSDEHPEIVSKYYGKIAKNDGITALNTMLAQDGLVVYVPKGVKVEKTVQVINILKAPSQPPRGEASETDSGSQRGASLMLNRRVLVIVEDEAQIRLLFCDHAADDRDFLTTQVVEAFVGEESQLELYCLEETHYKNSRVSNVYIEQQKNSVVKHNVITLHNGTTRNQTEVSLLGEGASCGLYGCVIADKQQHVDNNTLVIHHAPQCQSNELYKYVIDDQSVGVFAGRVLVKHGAQKTESQMRNQNLCATREARMFTQPMLEIYADDVKCAHGSTVGQLNDAAVFYMQQRGISLEQARLLLEIAFINEVIDQVELVPLRDRLHYLVEKRFRGELSKCEGCKLCQ
ncbi:MAG: Fe-S cluster assembly protein SufD [Prevotella sp.]|nr:Fe-S cluster assembly protein SufD [Prevotella sp.]